MAYIGKQPVVGNFVKLDAITTSATATYNLLNGGVAYYPQTANNCIVSLNGVIQSPTSAYTISGSTIVFDSALTSADSIDFILVLGDVLAIGTPSDATVSFAKVTSNLITGATAETSIAGGDSVLIYDDSASALRKMTRTNFVSGIGGVNTPLVQANLTGTDQSISSSVYTKIALNTETIDTGSIYNTGTYTATVATTGKYFVSAYCRLGALNGTSDFGVLRIANSANTTVYATTLQSGNTGYGFASLACSALVSLSANDTLSVFTYATETIDVIADQTGFTIFKVIE
jgi:hypothetical protein